MKVGEERVLYTYRYTVTTRMIPALRMGSDESHFNGVFFLIVRDKVSRQFPQTTIFFLRERRAEAESDRGPSAYQPNALPMMK